jgi:hydroxymethylpyrimidine/phosphomethylpyrimidine kinase
MALEGRGAMKIVATIAGSDSGGGAGIQADLRSISANGGFGVSVLTAVTAQNTRAVMAAEEISVEMIEAQFDAVFTDMTVAAAKTGMLASTRVIEAVERGLGKYAPPFYVLDPVMVSTTGYSLLADDAKQGLRERLFPLATVITPNVYEVEALTGRSVRSLKEAEEAGKQLLREGAYAVVVKGGHLLEEKAADLLVTREGAEAVRGEWIETKHTHGTGCTYSAAIATQLARGKTLLEAVRLSKAYVTEAIRGGLPIGHGSGPTDHFFYLRRDDCEEWMRRLALRESEGEW